MRPGYNVVFRIVGSYYVCAYVCMYVCVCVCLPACMYVCVRFAYVHVTMSLRIRRGRYTVDLAYCLQEVFVTY